MKTTDFAICPKCKSKTWIDMVALGDEQNTMRFKCKRCGWLIKLTGCKVCGASNWIRQNNVDGKGAKQAVVRYKCSGCSRVIGIFLDTL